MSSSNFCYHTSAYWVKLDCQIVTARLQQRDTLSPLETVDFCSSFFSRENMSHLALLQQPRPHWCLLVCEHGRGSINQRLGNREPEGKTRGSASSFWPQAVRVHAPLPFFVELKTDGLRALPTRMNFFTDLDFVVWPFISTQTVFFRVARNRAFGKFWKVTANKEEQQC